MCADRSTTDLARCIYIDSEGFPARRSGCIVESIKSCGRSLDMLAGFGLLSETTSICVARRVTPLVSKCKDHAVFKE